MDGKKTFDKYYNRIARESVLKSVICGLIIGFAVNFIAAFTTWFFEFNGLWLAIGVGILAAGAAIPLFYFKVFRPTAQKIARRIDRLGLEERLITMCELENDDSYIAIRQREDAMEKLNMLKTESIKFQISKIAIVAVCLLAVMGVSMTTVTTLSALGEAPSGGEFIEGILPPDHPKYVSITYEAEEGGEILGEIDQIVDYGGDATTVLAVAEEGWAFVKWDDGYLYPSRTDTEVTEDCVYTAIFEELEDSEEDDDEEEEDDSQNQPNEDDSQGQDGGGSGEGGGGGSNKYEDNNQIIDNETYYRDKYQEYYERAMEKLAKGEELTPMERAIIEAYWSIIE